MYNTINPLNFQAAPSLGNFGLGNQLFNGLNTGGAVAIAGPNGAYASAGGNASFSPGGLGGLSGGCGCGKGVPNFGNSFGGPGNAYQAGMQQGMKMAKIQRLQNQIARLQAELGGGNPGMAFGGGAPGAFAPAGPGGAVAIAGPGGAYASPLGGGRLV